MLVGASSTQPNPDPDPNWKCLVNPNHLSMFLAVHRALDRGLEGVGSPLQDEAEHGLDVFLPELIQEQESVVASHLRAQVRVVRECMHDVWERGLEASGSLYFSLSLALQI